MRVLIINTDYPAFLSWLYEQHPGLESASYDMQMEARNESLFGVADFYSRNLSKHGHEAWDVHANNDMMQAAWAREHGLKVDSSQWLNKAKRFAKASPLRILKPILKPFIPQTKQSHDVLAAQIRHYKPDILLNQDMDHVPDDFLWEMKSHFRLIVGQIAAPLGQQKKFRSYDLVISSLPNFVSYFREQGIRAELHRFAFETSILSRVPPRPRSIKVSFVGSISGHHRGRLNLLETVCAKTGLELWGQGVDSLPPKSHVRSRYRGGAWGKGMYEILAASKITLNHHIGIAENFANNMRLFEATGMGTLLITDRKDNLHEIFDITKEVVAYSSADECLEMIRYYLEHDAEREAIAQAGQRRTLAEHNYDARMRELADLFTAKLAA